MKTTAVRLYGANDLRLETFDLPPIQEDEILVRVVSDSLCLSSYKAAIQGAAHKRVPDDVATNPTIIGHEFCGVIEQVGAAWTGEWKPGDHFAIQPAINYKGSLAAPGYSYPHLGGNATYGIVPREFMEMKCLLPYNSKTFFNGSLAEPMSTLIGAFHAAYHTQPGVYVHDMGIKPGGRMAILAGAGPMGLGAIDYALHGPVRPSQLVVTDIDPARLDRAAALLPPGFHNGTTLHYVNTRNLADPVAELKRICGGAFDDVLVMAYVRAVVEQADALLGHDGCLNFFAGPSDPSFSANLNFYNVHYAATHIVGTSGGNTDDMRESLALMETGAINPAAMITHVGGLDSVIHATLHLPDIPGGKKLIYTHLTMPLTALDALDGELGEIVRANNGLWCAEAETYLLARGEGIAL
jgi:threonine dehydrogenase-like Zn-dependent dehydrogenase